MKLNTIFQPNRTREATAMNYLKLTFKKAIYKRVFRFPHCTISGAAKQKEAKEKGVPFCTPCFCAPKRDACGRDSRTRTYDLSHVKRAL